MILVTLGTQDKTFERLLIAIEKEVKKGNIKDKIIVQAGYTKFDTKNMELFDLLPIDELEKLTKECDFLITHGGVGSIMTALKHNKKVIAAPRLEKYKEHTNDHQKQVIDSLSEFGYILKLNDEFDNLGEILKKVKKFKPKKIESNNKAINLIREKIDEA